MTASEVSPSGPALASRTGVAWRRDIVVFSCVVLAALAGSVLHLLVRPTVYRATARILVTPQYTDDASWLGLSVLRGNPADPYAVFVSAAAMIDSPAAERLTARQLGRGWTPARVRSDVTVTANAKAIKVDGTSDTISVEADEPTTALAVRVADAFSRQALAAVEPTFEHQAARRLAAGPTYSGEQGYELRAVRRGLDPMFSQLHTVKTREVSAGGTPLRMLSLSLIPAVAFGLAAVLLVEAVGRRVPANLHAPPRASDAVIR